jgi:hypothetical protein
VAVADDNLHDNGTIEASGEYPTDRIRNAGGGRTRSRAGRLTWTVAEREIVRPRKVLNPQPLHIGRMDLVIEGCSKDPLAQYAAVAGPYAPPEWVRHNLRRGVSLLQREGRLASATRRWPQAPRDGCGGLDFEQDWTDHRLISRSSVKPRKVGDCMMNESWQELQGLKFHA